MEAVGLWDFHRLHHPTTLHAAFKDYSQVNLWLLDTLPGTLRGARRAELLKNAKETHAHARSGAWGSTRACALLRAAGDASSRPFLSFGPSAADSFVARRGSSTKQCVQAVQGNLASPLANQTTRAQTHPMTRLRADAQKPFWNAPDRGAETAFGSMSDGKHAWQGSMPAKPASASVRGQQAGSSTVSQCLR